MNCSKRFAIYLDTRNGLHETAPFAPTGNKMPIYYAQPLRLAFLWLLRDSP
jgi:hypothetical protein